MFQSIVDAISGSAWSYGIVFAVSAIDAFFPIVPSEATVIAAGVLAGSGDLSHRPGHPGGCGRSGLRRQRLATGSGASSANGSRDRLFTGDRRRHLDRAHRLLEERGGYLIIIGRFIPGGRTAATFAAGSLDWPWRRFIFFDVIAGVIWASYAALLGYFGGKTFETAPWKGLLVAFAVAASVAGLIELIRWYRKRSAQAS